MILEKPNPIHVEMDLEGDHHEEREFCYLVELGEDLVSVFMRNADEPPRVFKLNEEEMAWTEVHEIGGAALFLDFRVSYAVVSPEAGHGNRIYFPRYSENGKQAAFYDMETKAYHPSFYGLKSPLQCVWVVPNLRPHIVSK
uniref:KIB1-4 beta-propeller domain-containing protein n=2 Tax=Aegilops tauschii TaxID=37682 RepID=A0A453PX32_AEGTS